MDSAEAKGCVRKKKKKSLPDHPDQTVGSADRPFGRTGNQIKTIYKRKLTARTQRATNNHITVVASADNMMLHSAGQKVGVTSRAET